jgi:hypothetical protein
LERGIEIAIEIGRLGSIVIPKSFLAIESWMADPVTRKTAPKTSFESVVKMFSNLKVGTTRKFWFVCSESKAGTFCASSSGVFARYGSVFVL